MQKSLCARSKLSNMGCYRCNWLQFYTPFKSLEIKLEGGVWKSWDIFKDYFCWWVLHRPIFPFCYSVNRACAYPALCYLFVCVRVGQIFVARFTAHFWLIFGMNTSHHAQWCGHAPTCVLFSSPGPSLRLKGRLEIFLCDTIKWRSLTLFSADGKHLFSCNLNPLKTVQIFIALK